MPEGVYPPEGSRIAVAMSGGVDSSVAALLLAEAGYLVTGVTLKLFCLDENPELDSDRSCCSLESIEDAAAAAARIGIDHHVWDFTDPFRESVIDPFRRGYAAGLTPNPCVDCNRRVRFETLLDKVRRSGFPFFATGHYVRLVEEEGGGRSMLRGVDHAKDQSYMLWGIRSASLPHLVFPLGGLDKGQVRKEAERGRLAVAEKRESQDICFLPDGDLGRFLGAAEEGVIVDGAGNRLGKHEGAARFTIGQRRGLGVAAGEPLYVTGVDTERNEVRLGPEEDLYASVLTAAEENLHVPEEELTGRPVEAKIRYHHTPTRATVSRNPAGLIQVRFAEPQRAITPGQSVVFYRGDLLLGGAVIRAVHSS